MSFVNNMFSTHVLFSFNQNKHLKHLELYLLGCNVNHVLFTLVLIEDIPLEIHGH